MPKWFIPLSAVVVLSLNTMAGFAQVRGPGTVTFVDGQSIEAEILFEHPNAPRLIVRSPNRGTVQSLGLATIWKIEAGGQRKQYHAPRALTEAEQTARRRNGLWADTATERQIGKYARETWQPAPLIVWRHPGKSGDAKDAENWLDEAGVPLTMSPWSEVEDASPTRSAVTHRIDGDVLLPEADAPYAAIQPGKRDHLRAVQLRHLTVEDNAQYRVRYTVTGNLWMKDGSSLGQGTQTGGLGSGEANKHTFARFCNYHAYPEHKDAMAPGTQWAYAPNISHWVWIDTGDHGSLEVIGLSGGASDRLTLKRGTLIVGENCYIGNGDRGSFHNQENTTVILLDGARIGCPSPLMGGSGGAEMGTYGIAGTLMFGAPDHPLTRDLPFGGCYYDRQLVNPYTSPGQRTSGASFVLGKTGRMIVHSADPTTARVIFQPRSRQLPVSQYRVDRKLWQYIDRRGKAVYPPDAELWKHIDDRTGLAAVFHGETDFDGVHFDGFYEGGIFVAPNARAKWKHVTFGPDNHADPDHLFTDLVAD